MFILIVLLGLWTMQMGSVVNILAVHAASVFRVEYVGLVQQTHGGRVGAGDQNIYIHEHRLSYSL